jgi:hypothetical protein
MPYTKSPDRTAAEIVRAMVHRWRCDQITTFSLEYTTYLMGCPGILSAIRWQRWVHPSRSNYDTLYSDNSLTWLNISCPLGQCSAQLLVAASMQRTQCKDFDTELIFNDLADNASMWRSFVMGLELPEEDTNLQGCLEVLSSLPPYWSENCLYLWSWDNADAVLLQELSRRWQCSAVSVFNEAESARLLNTTNDGLLGMYEWDSVPRELFIITERRIAAVFTSAENLTASQKLEIALSDQLITEIEQSNLIVIGTPMYNYGMPTTLKAWFDQVIRVNRTFSFDLVRGDFPLEPILNWYF